ncbi:ABC transporter substrate-binding protein [Candidatus Acetothermia bacterium]|nr:MAG: ABC transporter substrate-binding protein [Candidatus Acetothermia bacterium]
MTRRFLIYLFVIASVSGLVASADDLEAVSIALDWTPNTNHTGIFVAQDLGYFADAGLEVAVLQPGPTGSVQLVGSGHADFGVSMEEYVTMARAQGIPVVSVAAVFPHNTSGFAAPADRGIVSPADFAGKRYGGWGSALEEVMIETVMGMEGADPASVTMVNIGTIDFVTAVRRDLADFFWIFYGWQGIHAEIEGIEFTYIPLRELADVLDYYTPVIITSEEMIATRSETVRRFIGALACGYVYAATHPDEAAEILLAHAPELDRDLVIASQRWLADQGLKTVDGWGDQELEVWARFADWAFANGLIDRPIDPEEAFTDGFVPAGEGE